MTAKDHLVQLVAGRDGDGDGRPFSIFLAGDADNDGGSETDHVCVGRRKAGRSARGEDWACEPSENGTSTPRSPGLRANGEAIRRRPRALNVEQVQLPRFGAANERETAYVNQPPWRAGRRAVSRGRLLAARCAREAVHHLQRRLEHMHGEHQRPRRQSSQPRCSRNSSCTKLFDDAGQGEHNVLALVDHYRERAINADARIAKGANCSEVNGLRLRCDHHVEEHAPDCTHRCLAVELPEALAAKGARK